MLFRSTASRSSVSPTRGATGTLAPPLEQSATIIEARNHEGPNIELLQTPNGKKGLKHRKSGRKLEVKEGKEQVSPGAMEVDEDSDS